MILLLVSTSMHFFTVQRIEVDMEERIGLEITGRILYIGIISHKSRVDADEENRRSEMFVLLVVCVFRVSVQTDYQACLAVSVTHSDAKIGNYQLAKCEFQKWKEKKANNNRENIGIVSTFFILHHNLSLHMYQSGSRVCVWMWMRIGKHMEAMLSLEPNMMAKKQCNKAVAHSFDSYLIKN